MVFNRKKKDKEKKIRFKGSLDINSQSRNENVNNYNNMLNENQNILGQFDKEAYLESFEEIPKRKRFRREKTHKYHDVDEIAIDPNRTHSSINKSQAHDFSKNNKKVIENKRPIKEDIQQKKYIENTTSIQKEIQNIQANEEPKKGVLNRNNDSQIKSNQLKTENSDVLKTSKQEPKKDISIVKTNKQPVNNAKTKKDEAKVKHVEKSVDSDIVRKSQVVHKETPIKKGDSVKPKKRKSDVQHVEKSINSDISQNLQSVLKETPIKKGDSVKPKKEESDVQHVEKSVDSDIIRKSQVVHKETPIKKETDIKSESNTSNKVSSKKVVKEVKSQHSHVDITKQKTEVKKEVKNNKSSDVTNKQKQQQPKKSVDEYVNNLVSDYKGGTAIKVDHLTMKFKISKDKIDSLKEYIIRTLKRNKEKKHIFTALDDVSFEIAKGDRVGIIGFNGAGKSTLLKILAGVYEPTSGKIMTKGKIAPLLELGAGFDMNYSGKDNIFLNGAFLGYTEDFIKSKYDEILEFSELGEAINYPLKNYSSGMRAKLGFSIATIMEPDILIIDEILSVGDIKFQKKSSDKIRSLIGSGITVLLVSHSVAQIRDLCSKAIWIDNGKIVMMGEVNKVCDAYVKAAQDATKEQLKNLQLN